MLKVDELICIASRQAAGALFGVLGVCWLFDSFRLDRSVLVPFGGGCGSLLAWMDSSFGLLMIRSACLGGVVVVILQWRV